MTPKELGQYVNNLIANAEIEVAIQQLLKYFSGKSEYRTYRSQVLYIQSQFKKTKKEEEKGLISFENAKLSYNRTTSQLLGIAAQLETGEMDKQVKRQRNTRRLGLLIGLPLFVAVAWGAWLYSLDQGLVGVDEYVCPDYNDLNKFNILVLPFRPIDSEQNFVRTHERILDRFAQLSESRELMTEQATLGRETFALSESQYPRTVSAATKIARACNSDLIIWGTTETLNDGKIATRRLFKFLNLDDNFALERITEVSGDKVETVMQQTSISTGNAITQEVEAILLGIMAFYDGDTETAEELLSISSSPEVEKPDSAAIEAWGDTELLRRTFLANAQIKAGHLDEAEKTYDSLLIVHPEYKLGRNNRGMLKYRQGDYMQAIEDLSVILKQDEANANARVQRAQIYREADMLLPAKQDLEAARKMDEKNVDIEKNLDQVNEEIREARKTAQKTKMQANRDPRNEELWRENAVANYRIQNYTDALSSAQKLLRVNPADTTAKGVIVKSLAAQGKVADLQRFLSQQATKNNGTLERVIPKSALRSLPREIQPVNNKN